ncbi:MAG: hypothetical protein GEU82_17710 [Luteitalea sp.]|nr:hypothetical protein [Luteitalea sp.]
MRYGKADAVRRSKLVAGVLEMKQLLSPAALAEVHSAPAEVDAAGIAGRRVNHNLNVRVESSGVL